MKKSATGASTLIVLDRICLSLRATENHCQLIPTRIEDGISPITLDGDRLSAPLPSGFGPPLRRRHIDLLANYRTDIHREPIDAAILRHPFVRGLTDGSLPRPSFRSSAVQDGDRGVVKTLTKRHSPCRFGQRLCAFGRSLASTA